MDKLTLNFMSYNSTGLDTPKIIWIQDLIRTCKIDHFQIQEHFKSSKAADKIFKNSFDNSDSYTIPAYREKFQESGRGKGGLAQISARCSNVKLEIGESTNQELENSSSDP